VTHRIERLPGGVAALVDKVPESEIPRCLQLLALTAIDVNDLGGSEVVRGALAQWRQHGQVSGKTRLDVESLMYSRDRDGFAHQRRGDTTAHHQCFFQARALNCLAHGVNNRVDPRDALRDAAYEAAAAMKGSAGVVAILSDFVE
jgi:hypothetical protein